MNDEIKEILEDLLFTTTLPNVSVKLNEEKINQLKDYITNLQTIEREYSAILSENAELQQENQEMKTNTIPTLEHNIDALVDEVDELQDYKSRCEKAIEYLNGNKHTCNYVDIYNYALREEDLLNILQNGSDSQ